MVPTYALGRPLPSPPPCAHGGGVQKAQEKLTGRSPCFSGAVGGATGSSVVDWYTVKKDIDGRKIINLYFSVDKRCLIGLSLSNSSL